MYDYLNLHGYYFPVYAGTTTKTFILWVSGHLNRNSLCELPEHLGLIVTSTRKEAVGGTMSGIMNTS